MSQVRPRLGLSIRYKFLFVTTLLLISSVSAYLFLASQIFKNDKTELVFDLTRSIVANRSAEIETLLVGITDKMKIVALLAESPSAHNHEIIRDIFQNENDLVYLGRSDQFTQIDESFFSDPVFAQTYNTSEPYYTQVLPAKRPIPFKQIQVDGEAIWNATIEGGPPLIGYGKNVMTEMPGKASSPFAMIAFLRADQILQSLSNERSSEVFVTNNAGQVLVHADPKVMQTAPIMLEHPLFKFSRESAVKTGVAEYIYQGRSWLGAQSHGFHNKILVFSQVSNDKAFSAVRRLLTRSLLFALIVVTLAFIAAILFSRSLTKPIQVLINATKAVAGGNLQTEIKVRSRDEISILAGSFNKMIQDLRDSREELEEANRDLEKKVQDRTQKLAEQNQAVKKAQEALLQSTRLAAVGEIAGRAAHEVLNPLTSILTRLEKVRNRLSSASSQDIIFLRDICDSWQKEYSEGGMEKLLKDWMEPSSVNQSMNLWEEDLQNIRQVQNDWMTQTEQLISDTDFLLKEGNRINKIVQNMRTLTIVNGNVQTMSVHKLLHEAGNIMADLADQCKIKIVEEFVAERDLVELDPDEFIQSATNLIRNSIQAINTHHASSGAGEIRLCTRIENGSLMVDIHDNGIGIEPQHQDKLFETQFTTKSKDEGTGLGLSISRRFMRAYGGDIYLLNSNHRAGSVFRIQLPLKSHEQEKGGMAV